MSAEFYIACPDNTDLRKIAADKTAEYREWGWWVDGPFVPAADYRGAVEALRALEHGWKHFYDRNAGAWGREHDGDPLTLANYVRFHLGGQ